MRNLICTLFLILSVLALKAQDTYEFAKVTYVQNTIGTPARLCITIAKENADFQIVQLDKSEIAKSDYLDSSPFLKYLKRMRGEGWEVYQLSPYGNGDVAYLRRKKS